MKNSLLQIYIYGAALLGFAMCCTLIFVITSNAAPALSPQFIFTPSTKGGTAGGVLFQVLGSVILGLTALPLMLIFSVTLSLWRFYHSTEKANTGFFAKCFDTLLKASHSVPSVAWGLVGFLFLVRFAHLGKSWLAGGITLALVGTPFVIEACLTALRSIPKEAIITSKSLGLNEQRILKSILLPYAFSGAFSGLRISIPRILGETAPILLTACVFSGVTFPKGIQHEPILSLPYHVYLLSQESYSETALQNAWGAGVAIIAMGIVFRILIGVVNKKVFGASAIQT